jgi:hypothetical protein
MIQAGCQLFAGQRGSPPLNVLLAQTTETHRSLEEFDDERIFVALAVALLYRAEDRQNQPGDGNHGIDREKEKANHEPP